MLTVTRRRRLPATPERIWSIVAAPERLVEWWPSVQRVEDVSAGAWTTVLKPPRGGRAVRVDYTLLESEHPRRRAWRQEVEESPFERLFKSVTTELTLEPAEDGGAEAALEEQVSLRGYSRFGGFQIRRATRRKLDAALKGLEERVRASGWADR
jgi:uncharacterized protein YndB with AHSA1/START domain